VSDIKRYAVVLEKFRREVVLLKSLGCRWGGCRFCDYKDDFENDFQKNIEFNREILGKVQGRFGVLQVIDSAAFCELPDETIENCIEICRQKRVKTVILEQHFNYRAAIPALRKRFEKFGTECKFIAGVETFDGVFREKVLNKGMGYPSPAEISRHFEWVNLLVGLQGQTIESIARDVETGLKFFERITVNVFIPNSTPFVRDGVLVEKFYSDGVFKQIKDDTRAEILDILDRRAPDFLGGIGYPESP
jgi:uncharacterized Fe-S cluster-containing MiaB family protein